MIKAIIVEDELHCQERLVELLKKMDHNIHILERFENISDVQRYLYSEKVDLVFLDIELKDGTAFNLLQSLEKIEFDIIFTTAHNSYALQAFDYSAVHYLLKPIEFDKLLEATERVKLRRTKGDSFQELKELLHNLEVHTSLDKSLAVPTVEGFEFVKTGEILRIQADGNYSKLYLIGGQKLTVSKTLKHFDKLLDNLHFSRVHQSHIVNLGHVSRYIKGQGGTLILSSEDKIPVSVRKKDEFLSQLSKNKQI